MACLKVMQNARNGCEKAMRGSPEMMIGLHDDTFIIVGFRRSWCIVEHFLKGKLIPLHDMKARGIMEVQLHGFLTCAMCGHPVNRGNHCLSASHSRPVSSWQTHLSSSDVQPAFSSNIFPMWA
jgi:hypothetical protein